MEHARPTVYGYRWAILFVFALLNVVIQVHWVALAPITTEAAAYYGVSPMSIGFLSMIFMLVHAYGIGRMFLVYGIAAAAAAVLFFLFFKEEPPTPPSPASEEERFAVLKGLRHILRQRQMQMLLVLFFIGIGIFNAVTTWIEKILGPRGFSAEQAGIAGAAMIFGGIVGASILPPLSDKVRRRVPFLAAAMLFTIPGLAGLAFARNYAILCIFRARPLREFG